MVRLDPTLGSEIQKTRRAIVIGARQFEYLSVRLMVPLTSWDDKHRRWSWRPRIQPDRLNGLQVDSAALPEQMRSLSLERFVERSGRLSAEDFDEIRAAVALALDLD